MIAHERPDGALAWVCREGLGDKLRVEAVVLEGESAGAVEDELDQDGDEAADDGGDEP